ncbi:MAG: DNA translocase FtsK [Treponema sp.]|nr:DNA translocase FtsK [Treponema sp.]
MPTFIKDKGKDLDFETRPENKKKSPLNLPVRVASLIGGGVLTVFAVGLSLSIVDAFFNIEGFSFNLGGLGVFFADAYGILAFAIPLYILCNAFLLFEPVYRPSRMFVLLCCIIPFLTLAFSGNINRNFDAVMENSAFFAAIGRFGFICIVLFVIILETIFIVFITGLLFSGKVSPPKNEPNKNNDSVKTEHRRTVPPRGPPAKILPLIPVIKPTNPAKTEPPKPKHKEYHNEESIDFDFPELKPLSSREAFRDFEATLSKSNESVKRVYTPAARTPSAYVPEPFDQDPREITDPAKYNDDDARRTQKPVAYTPSAYVDIPEPFDQDPEEITDPMKYNDDDPRHTQQKPAAYTPSAYVDMPEPFDQDPQEITDPAQYNDDDPQRTQQKPAAHTSSVVERQPRKWRNYHIPVLGILNDYPDGQYWIIDDATRAAATILKDTLSEFKIHAEVTGIRKGPVITMFEILPAPGVKLSRIVNLQDNIALRLAAASVRIVAPIPGKHAVGIEVPNAKRNIVSFAEIIEYDINSDNDGKHMGIPVVLGKDIAGEAQTVDLTQMPHLLIAGATGSGKSVCVNAMILSILYRRSPNEVRLILIDPKIVELKLYNDIPHLLTPVITEPKKAFQALQYCVCEMERRYACLDSMGVRDIKSYNKRIKERNIATEHMPYIVVVIDEFADLMATTGKDLESTFSRLAAMSRAVGVHLVLATQRPSIDVITGLIKANIPSRIAFMVASKTDSRIIIDVVGAEKLLGKGDMLYAGIVDPFPVRMQGAFVSEEEVERLVDYVKTLGKPDYIDDEIFFDDDDNMEQELFTEGNDPLYEKAWEIVLQQGKASASYIQRKLKIGYNRAARLVEEMESRGLVGPANGSKPRDLLRGV